ncbi:hypothetical protein [Chitinophaga rhizophila]|uniref:AhpC/TSA family protein n=1 Tax=Chitinophaga rhizophila TaxID=2866212 RepID=A0ABS7G8W1_9BACT|nr:hypothetical protein [Chitinophaga rhizophila]MBW8683886.1 hypothetical protein [Chitinophaga rhizophila]
MRLRIILCCLMLSMITLSCEQTDANKEGTIIEDGIKELKLKPQYDWLVIMPGLGCRGCIQEAEAFMRDYLDKPEILFVLTKVQSLKILEQKIGKELHSRQNVYIDKQGYFDIPTNNTIYPCIVQLDKGKVVEHQFQSPENGQAFQLLKTQIE